MDLDRLSVCAGASSASACKLRVVADDLANDIQL
jgi:hypothetical protein